MVTDVRNSASTAIKEKSALSLQHLASVRHAIFADGECRKAFIINFMNQMVIFLQSPAIQSTFLRERRLYKELVPIIQKLQINFQVRDLLKGGDALFEGYLNELFKFTQVSFKSNNAGIMFHAGWLNNLWQRIFLESMSIGLAVKDHLNGLMR